MKKLRIVALVLIIVVLSYTVIALLPRPQGYEGKNPLISDTDMPILIAHRGGDGEFPGNTMEAFYNAYSVDERVIFETDASLTRDGVLILCHDTYLDDYTNASGNIIDWNYSDLISGEVDFGYNNKMKDGVVTEQLRFKNERGEHVTPTDVDYPEGVLPRHDSIFLATTLEDLLTAFPNNIVSVEIKQEGEVGLRAHKEALRIIDEHDAWDRVIVASFHDEIYEKSREEAADDGRQNGMLFSPSLGAVVRYYVLQLLGLDLFFGDRIAVFQIPTEKMGFTLATKGFIKSAHKHNIAVHYWTINSEDEMRELVELGADGIMTDYPHRLKAVYDSYSKGE